MKQVIIAVLVVVGIIVGATFIGGKDSTVTAGTPSNNYYGQETGLVTLTEYGDFQCPACGQFFPIVKQVKEKFKDQIRFEFKNFPLVQIHPNAIAAHRAAQAAANQGKFWEMHDLIYENQASWNSTKNPTAVFDQFAQQIGLDSTRFKTDSASSDVLATINADTAMGKELNITGTPTFLIDGKLLGDPNTISSVDSFSKVVQDAIDAKKNSSAPTN